MVVPSKRRDDDSAFPLVILMDSTPEANARGGFAPLSGGEGHEVNQQEGQPGNDHADDDHFLVLLAASRGHLRGRRRLGLDPAGRGLPRALDLGLSAECGLALLDSMLIPDFVVSGNT